MMYTEDEERKGFPLRDFLVKLLLIIIFVLLLVWLFPMPNMKGINDKIFNANIQGMKDAATSYFTTERLPEEVGDTVKLTLKEMLDMHLLLPFTDKNGDACDTTSSYVTLKKLDTEYEMKVNLKCNKEENYIIVKLGCYDYCEGTLCEQQCEDCNVEEPKPSEPSCTLEVSGTAGRNGWYLSNATVKFKSKNPGEGATITSYGLGLTQTFNKQDNYTVSEDGTTKVFGYVKDSNGKTAVCSVTVKKDTVKPECKVEVLSGNQNSNGVYTSDVVVGLTSKIDKTSTIESYGITNSTTVTYNGSDKYTITSNGTHKIFGYVRDFAGNTASCNVTVKREKPTNPPTSAPECSLEVKTGTIGANGWYLSNVNVGFKSKTTTNNATITGFGLGYNENYNGNDPFTVTSDGSTTVYGYVKDSNGNTARCSVIVKKDSNKPACELNVTSGTLNSSGYYTSDIVIGWKSKTESTSGINAYGLGKTLNYNGYNSLTINTNGVHTVYGYIKDNAGNTNTCSITVEKRDVEYEWQYKKDIAAQYSNWSDWTTATYNPSNPPKFGTFETLIAEDLGKTTVEDKYVYSVGEPITQVRIAETGSVTKRTCTGYTYYNTTTTTTTYAISTYASWEYKGQVSLSGAPSDTLSTKWVLVGTDFSRCERDTSCNPQTNPYRIWDKYVRTVYTVSSVSGQDVINELSATCNTYEEKQTKLFNTYTQIVGYTIIRTMTYKDVYQYRYKTRTLISEATTDYKWSYYNNQTLISQGYTMTGNKRVKE